MKLVASLAAVLCLTVCTAPPAAAWGRVAHVAIGRIAAQSLPAGVPAFLRTSEAIEEIAQLGPEADNLKGAGRTRDDDDNPGHFLDLADDGSIGGVVHLSALPIDRERYDTLLRSASTNEYRAGYLPYAIIDGYEVVRKDFAFWRVADFGARTAANADDRAAFARFRALRETLTLRDVGYWGHFVVDGSQPLHVTVHYDGWEERYSRSKGLHSRFETTYVNRYVDEAAVKAVLRPLSSCGCTIEQGVQAYLVATNARVIPLYELFKNGAFETRTDAGVAFVAARMADGAAELRDLIVQAWDESANGTVGYQHVPVADIVSGRVPLARGLLYAE